MSAIDERVVQMTFENHLFEKNVNTSIGTLEKLKNALNFNKAGDGLEGLETNIKKADFSSLSTAVQNISDHFSTMGIVGMSALSRITNEAINVGSTIVKHVLSPLTSALNQIKQGGWARASNIAQAKFLLEGLDVEWEKIYPDINKAVSGTAYGLDAAATAAAKLAASGVEYGGEDSAMYRGLRGIAGLAAMTSESYERVALVYSQIAAAGRLMGQDLMQLNSLGINITATLAQKMGKTEEEVRELISKGEIDFATFSEKMYEAYGEQAGKANETFTGALSNMRAALSRIGEKFATPYQQGMKNVYNALRVMIDKISDKLKPVYTECEGFIKKVTDFASKFINDLNVGFVDGIVNKFQKFAELINKVFDTFTKALEKTTDKTAVVGRKFDQVKDKVKNVTGAVQKFTDKSKSIAKLKEGLENASKPLGAMEKMAPGVTKAVSAIDSATTSIDGANKAADNSTPLDNLATIIRGLGAAFDIIKKVFEAITDTVGKPVGYVVDKLLEMGAAVSNLVIQFDKDFKVSELFGFKKSQVDDFTDGVNDSIEATKSLDEVVQAVIRGDYKNAPERFDLLEKAGFNPYVVQNKVNEALGCLFRYEVETEDFVAANQNASDSIVEIIKPLGKLTVAEKIAEIVKGLASAFNIAKRFAIAFIDAIQGPIGRIFKAVGNVALTVGTGVARLFIDLDEWLTRTGGYEKLSDVLTRLFDSIATGVEKTAEAAGPIIETVFRKIRGLGRVILGIKDRITMFLDAFKQTEGYTRLKETFDSLKKIFIDLKNGVLSVVLGLLTKLGIVGKDIFDKTGDFSTMEGIAGTVSNIVVGILDSFTSLKNTIFGLFGIGSGTSIFDAVISFFENLNLTNIVESVKSALGEVGRFLGWIFLPQTVSASTSYDDPRMQAYYESVNGAMQNTAETSQEASVQTQSALVTTIKAIVGFFRGLSDGTITIDNIIAAIEKKIVSFFKWLYPSFTGSLDDFRGIFRQFSLFLVEKDLWKFARSLIKFFSFGGITESVTNMASNFSKILGGISEYINQYAKGIKRLSKGKSRNETATAILKVAAAIGILALSFKLLSTISWDQFKVAAAAIGVITLALVILMGALSKLKGFGGGSKDHGTPLEQVLDPFKDSVAKFLKKMGKAGMLVAFGIAIVNLVKAIKYLTEIDWADLGKAIVAMGIVMIELAVGLALANKALSVGGGPSVRGALTLIAYGLAVKMVAGSFAALSKLSTQQINKAGKALGAIALAMAGVLATSSKSKWGSMLVLAGIILEVTLALVGLSLLPADRLEASSKAISSIFGAFALFNGSNFLLKNGTKDEMAEGIIGIAGLLAEIVGLFALAKDLDPKHMTQMADAISDIMYSLAAMMAALGVFSKLTKAQGPGAFGTGISVAAVAGIVLLVVTAVTEIGAIIEHFFPGANDFLQKGLPFLTTIGEALGNLIGGVLEKALLEPLKRVFGGGETFSDKLASLKTFIEDMLAIFSGDIQVNTTSVDAITDLFLAVAGADLLGAISNFINGVTEWFSGGQVETFSEKITKYGEFITAVAELFKPGEYTFDKEAATTFSEILEAFGAAELSDSVSNLINALDPLSLFTPSLGEKLVSFAGEVKKYADAIDGLNSSAVTETADAVKIVIELCKMTPESGGLLQAITGEHSFNKMSFGLIGFGRKMKQYSEVISGMDVGAVENTKTAVASVIELSKQTPKYNGWIQEFFGENSVSKMSNGLPEFGERMVGYSEAIEGMKSDAVENTKAAVGSVIELANAIPNQGGILSWIVGDNKISDFGDNLVVFSEDIATYAANLTGLDFNGARQANTILNHLNSAFLRIEDNFFLSNFNYDTKADELVKGVMNIFNKFSYELGNGTSYKELEDAGKNLFEKVLGGFYSMCADSDKSTEIGTKLSSAFTNDTVTSGVGTSGETVGTTLLDGVKKKIDDNPTYLNESITTLFSKTTTTIESKKSDIHTATDTAMSGATELLDSLVAAFETSGINLMVGLSNGIDKGKTFATNAIKSAAINVLLSGNNTLGIKSPSTKAFESGMYFMQGFGNGILQNQGVATNAVSTVATSTLGAMNGELSGYGRSSSDVLNEFVNTLTATWLYIKSIADESLDSQPVISPVLDLTNIERGANGIDGILNGYGIGSSNLAGIRSTMVGYSGPSTPDSVTIEEFTSNMRGVREDIRMLGSAIENMKLVLDTGLLVGQISNGVDKQLGNRAMLLSRWA